MINELIHRVFQARNFAHITHWRTQSYAQHMALDEFYNNVIDSLDTVVEAYQGRFGLVDAIPETEDVKTSDILGYLKAEQKWLTTNRDAIAERNQAIANLVDELTAVYLKAIYKLENLK